MTDKPEAQPSQREMRSSSLSSNVPNPTLEADLLHEILKNLGEFLSCGPNYHEITAAIVKLKVAASLSSKEATDIKLYATYADGCARQKIPLMPFDAWKREQPITWSSIDKEIRDKALRGE